MPIRFRSPHPNRDDVALVLAFGLCTSVVTITVAVMVDALTSDRAGLSENATQVLTTALAGMIGLIGGYIGGQRKPGDSSGGEGEDPSVDDLDDEHPPTP